MADTGTAEATKETPEEQPAPRRRPGRPRGSKNNNGGGKQKAPALYHLFSKTNKGVLTPVGDVEARTAEVAVNSFLKKPPKDQEEFVKRVKDGKEVVVAIPERNYTEVGAEEEVKTTLRIKARK